MERREPTVEKRTWAGCLKESIQRSTSEGFKAKGPLMDWQEGPKGQTLPSSRKKALGFPSVASGLGERERERTDGSIQSSLPTYLAILRPLRRREHNGLGPLLPLLATRMPYKYC